jgi:hypothetical protein
MIWIYSRENQGFVLKVGKVSEKFRRRVPVGCPEDHGSDRQRAWVMIGSLESMARRDASNDVPLAFGKLRSMTTTSHRFSRSQSKALSASIVALEGCPSKYG